MQLPLEIEIRISPPEKTLPGLSRWPMASGWITLIAIFLIAAALFVLLAALPA
jgi:hypothetical protein